MTMFASHARIAFVVAARRAHFNQVLASILSLEVLATEINNSIVEVFPAEVCVTSSYLHLEDSILDGQQRHIEGATTHVVDKNVALSAPFLVQAIGNCSRRRFVDNTEYIHT